MRMNAMAMMKNPSDHTEKISIYPSVELEYTDIGCENTSQLNDVTNYMYFESKDEQVTRQLRDMLINARWSRILPGYRVLTKELGVGRSYIDKALARLTQEGLLEPAEKGKARKINPSAFSKKSSKPETKIKTILIIAPCNWDDLPHSTLEVLREIREHCNTNGYNLSYAVVSTIGRQKLDGYIDRLIRNYQVSHLLMVTPTESLVMCLSQKKMPFFCLGGEIPKAAGKCDVTLVLIEEMIKPAVRHLMMHGHSEILCPMQLGREMTRDILWEHFRNEDRIKMTRKLFDSTFPIQDISNSNILASFWEKNYTQLRPTAIILQNYNELLSFYDFCIKHRLSIPLDISVIALFDHPSLPWLSPHLTRFVVPTKKMIRHIIKWIARDEHDPQGTFKIQPLAINGETVADLS